LHRVLGQPFVAEDPQREPPGDSAETVVELGERNLLRARHQHDQRLVRQVRKLAIHPRNSHRRAFWFTSGRESRRITSLREMGIAELTRNAVDVLPQGELERKLALGRPLLVKLGIDVTSPDIHVGRGIPLQRMRAFQDEGHLGVLIVGDYTTRIGDPSGRSSERPILSDEEIDRNAKTYVEQAYQIIDPAKTELRFNGEWLSNLDFAEILRLTRTTTVARLLERDDFAKRYAAREPISVSELLYPLMQAYDSVAVQADVELGGTDQLYNLLAGRDVMEAYGLEPQVVLTTPLLVSWDGEKMSSSLGNNIPLTMAPEDQFGRTMRIPDSLLPEWWTLVAEQEVPPGEPLEAKLALARWIVARSHAEEAARRAEGHFNRVVREGQAPEEIPEAPLPSGETVHLPRLLQACFGVSTSEGRRLIDQGAVRVGDDVVRELDLPRERLAGAVLQAGKRRFVRFGTA
jgi:tyrosyl-tRNA synthetase